MQRQPARQTSPDAATQPASATTASVVRPSGLTPQEEARAAELEAAIVAEERQAEEKSKQSRSARTDPTPRATSSLETSAAAEYAYVARDVRRIAIVGGSLFAVLIGLWVVSQVIGPIAF
jgi:hypothetical protein